MFSDLIEVNGFDHKPRHPSGLGHGPRLLGELPEGVAIPLGRPVRDGERFLR